MTILYTVCNWVRNGVEIAICVKFSHCNFMDGKKNTNATILRLGIVFAFVWVLRISLLL